jgi:hypothetical protein
MSREIIDYIEPIRMEVSPAIPRDNQLEYDLLFIDRVIYELQATLKRAAVQYWLPSATKDCRITYMGQSPTMKLEDIRGKYYLLKYGAKSIMLCYQDDAENIRSSKIYFGRIYEYGGDESKDFKDLIDLYAKINDLPYGKGLQQLVRMFNLNSDSVMKPPQRPSGWTFWSHVHDPKNTSAGYDLGKQYLFYNEDYTLAGVVREIVKADGKVYLPGTLIERSGSFQLLPLAIFSFDKLPLYNAPLLKNRASADIFLTDCLATADQCQSLLQDDFSKVWTTWYSGPKQTLNCDLKLLKNRNVFYVLSGTEAERSLKYEIASHAYYKLMMVADIKLNFIDNYEDAPLLLTPEEFLGRLSSFDIAPPDLTVRKRQLNLHTKTPKDLKADKPIQYLLKPVIPKESISILYAEEGVGKTWAAMSMAYAAAFGVDCFSGRWTASKPVKVLYLDGEMGESALARRNKVISTAMLDDLHDEDLVKRQSNMLFHSMNDEILDLTTPEDQYLVESLIAEENRKGNGKVQLLVLDNLLTLTNFADSGKAWNDLFGWLKRLKHRHISILICHHANKVGGQRGSGVKTAVVDNVIRLQKVNAISTSKIAMKIDIEKGRELFGNDKKSMTLELNPKDEKPCWKVLPRFKNKTELKAHLKLLEEETTLKPDEKAEELEISRNEYYKLKREMVADGQLSKKK